MQVPWRGLQGTSCFKTLLDTCSREVAAHWGVKPECRTASCRYNTALLLLLSDSQSAECRRKGRHLPGFASGTTVWIVSGALPACRLQAWASWALPRSRIWIKACRTLPLHAVAMNTLRPTITSTLQRRMYKRSG